MFRLDRLIRRDMILRDVEPRHPEAIPIFEPFRFSPVCDACDIETGARNKRFHFPNAAEAPDQAAFGLKADTGDHVSI